MADEAQIDIVMNGVDNGAQAMIESVNSGLGETASKSDEAAGGAGRLSSAFDAGKTALTEFNSGIQIGKEALQISQQAYDATIGKALAYGETIRSLSVISGQSAEDTSRMVQVFDDFQVSTGDVESALRKMTANGMVPSLDTIATLGEQYRAIQDPMEKNQFVIDNLGRSGQAYNQILGLTREELEANAAAVNENLVLNQRQLDELDQLRLVQDGVADTWDSILISIGTKGAPIMSNWLTMVDNATKGQGSWQERIQRTNGLAVIPAIDLLLQYSDAANQNTVALDEAAKKAKEKEAATLLSAEADRIAAEQAKAASEAYTNIMSLQSQLVNQQGSYTKSVADLSIQQADLNTKIADATSKYGANSSQVATLQGQYDGLVAKQTELADSNETATRRMIANSALAKLAADGWTDSEFAKAQQIQVGLGLMTQAQADEAIKINNLTTAVAEGEISVGKFNQAVRDGSLEVQSSKEKEQTTWSNYAGAVETSSSRAKTAVDDYIKKLSEVPTSIQTEFIQKFPDDSGSQSLGTQAVANRSGSVVNNFYIENAMFNENNELVSLVG